MKNFCYFQVLTAMYIYGIQESNNLKKFIHIPQKRMEWLLVINTTKLFQVFIFILHIYLKLYFFFC